MYCLLNHEYTYMVEMILTFQSARGLVIRLDLPIGPRRKIELVCGLSWRFIDVCG